MDWYYLEDGRRIGPIDAATLETLVRAGAVRAGTLVWREGMADWQPYAAVRPAESAAGGTAAGTLPYAGFWIRVVAKLVDSAILWGAGSALSVAAGYLMYGQAPQTPSPFLDDRPPILLLQFAVAAAYSTAFVGRYGATPGKMAAGLKVVTPAGAAVSYGTALCRHFAEILNSVTLGIGYLMVAFDLEKRGLHDRICRTRVVFK